MDLYYADQRKQTETPTDGLIQCWQPPSITSSPCLLFSESSPSPKPSSAGGHLLSLSDSTPGKCLFQILHQPDLFFIKHLCTCIRFLFPDLFLESRPLSLCGDSPPVWVINLFTQSHQSSTVIILTAEPNLERVSLHHNEDFKKMTIVVVIKCLKNLFKSST